MMQKQILTEGEPHFKTPYERAKQERITDLNHLVVVFSVDDVNDLKRQFELKEVIAEKLSNKRMTHLGVGVATDPQGTKWVTIHMLERAVTFTQFSLEASSGVFEKKSIRMEGRTLYEKINVNMTFLGPTEPEKAVTKIETPDLSGAFSLMFNFTFGPGNYQFSFSILSGAGYRETNRFSIEVN
jgi:hypothetical protein